jgi:hypothetical protein
VIEEQLRGRTKGPVAQSGYRDSGLETSLFGEEPSNGGIIYRAGFGDKGRRIHEPDEVQLFATPAEGHVLQAGKLDSEPFASATP